MEFCLECSPRIRSEANEPDKEKQKEEGKKTTLSKNSIQKNNGENKGSKTKLYSGSNRWRRKLVW